MISSAEIFGVCVLWIAVIIGGGHCDTITLQPNINNGPQPGVSYSWIVPPPSQLSPISKPPSDTPSGFDPRNESPITPIGGYGHRPFYIRHSQEQLSLPNEYLISPSSDSHHRRGEVSSPPLFRQLDPEWQLPTMQHSNTASVPVIIPQSPLPPSSSSSSNHHQQQGSGPTAPEQPPVNWPSSPGAVFGFLFFVPESASHLPVEQLIHQQLVLHRTQFPFDISINCQDAADAAPSFRCINVGGLSLSPPPTPSPTTINGWNVENVNYAGLPLVVNSISRRQGSPSPSQQEQQRKWRTLSERIVRNKHQLQLQEQQLQLNQRELSLIP